MSRRRSYKRPLLNRLLVPPRFEGRGKFLLGYFKRIPVYVLVVVLAGLTVTLLSTLAIADTATVVDIPVVSTDIRSRNAIHYQVYRGMVGGYITVDLKPFWAVFAGDIDKVEIKLMWPQLEKQVKTGDSYDPENGGFPCRDLKWSSDASGLLRTFPGITADWAFLENPEVLEIRFSMDEQGYEWRMSERNKEKIRDGTWPVFQFAIQIVEDNKIIWASSKGYDVRAHLDNDGDPVFDPLLVTEGTWDVINGEIIPDLIWPTGFFWDTVWGVRGSTPVKSTGLNHLGLLGDALYETTKFLQIPIFDTEWGGPWRYGIGGFLFWASGAEFLFVDLFGLIPYVTGTNYHYTMNMGESFGFWVFKVGFDLMPALVIGGIVGWFLAPMIPTIAGAMAGQAVAEVPKYLVTIPRRAILLLFAFIGLTISGFGLLFGFIKIAPALLLFMISTITFLYSFIADTTKMTRRTIVFLIAIPTFIMGAILLAMSISLGGVLIIASFVAAGLETITSPLMGLGRTVAGPSSHKRHKARNKSYQKMVEKIRIKR